MSPLCVQAIAGALAAALVGGCGPPSDQAQIEGQLAAAEAAAAKAVAAQKRAEDAAASIAAAAPEPDQTDVEGNGEFDEPSGEVFDNTIVSPPALDPPAA